jgi:hypothetical protein
VARTVWNTRFAGTPDRISQNNFVTRQLRHHSQHSAAEANGSSFLIPPLRLPLHSATRQNVQHLPDHLFAIGELRQGEVGLDLIAITATRSLLDEITGIGEIGDDGVSMSVGDAEVGRDVAQAYVGIMGDAKQSPPVVGEEAPVGH